MNIRAHSAKSFGPGRGRGQRRKLPNGGADSSRVCSAKASRAICGNGDASGVPDLEWVKRNLPITDIAEKLGLEIRGRMIRCWRPEAHGHGDRTPSVGVYYRRNRVKCFGTGCEGKLLSPIDLVMSVLNVKVFDAVLWLDGRFNIPRIPKGTNLALKSKSIRPYRVSVSGFQFEGLIRSGLFAEMGDSEIRLLNVLCAYADAQTGLATLSYAALRRYSGIRKDSTVSKAVKQLERLHAVEITRGRGGNGLSACNQYRLTLEDTRLLKAQYDCYAPMRDEIEAQRKIRAKLRGRRVFLLADHKASVSPQQSRQHTKPPAVITGINLSAIERSATQSATAIQWEWEL